MVTVCGVDTMDGALLLMFIARELLIGGEMVTVRMPLVPGVRASWLGLNVSVDEVSVTLIVAVAPFRVVTLIVSVPADRAVISAVIRVSVTSTPFMETKPPLAVTVSVVRRFWPVIDTNILEPTKRTFGLIAVSAGDPPDVVALVLEIRLPSSS